MGIFARAVISGFGFTLGATLFKKVSKHLGLDEPEDNESEAHLVQDDGDAGEPAGVVC